MITFSSFSRPPCGVDDVLYRPFLGLGQTHLSAPTVTAIAVPLLLAGFWYWRRLGRISVLPIRRRIRRISLLMAGVAMIATAAATGWIDPDVWPISYLSVWAVAMITLLILVLCAVLDAVVSIRLHQRIVDRRLFRDTIRLQSAIERSGGDDVGKEPPNA
jgi:hypothetical protein